MGIEITKPAAKGSDERLFDRSARSIRKLQKQSRAELREKARKAWWAEQQKAAANG